MHRSSKAPGFVTICTISGLHCNVASDLTLKVFTGQMQRRQEADNDISVIRRFTRAELEDFHL